MYNLRATSNWNSYLTDLRLMTETKLGGVSHAQTSNNMIGASGYNESKQVS